MNPYFSQTFQWSHVQCWQHWQDSFFVFSFSCFCCWRQNLLILRKNCIDQRLSSCRDLLGVEINSFVCCSNCVPSHIVSRSTSRHILGPFQTLRRSPLTFRVVLNLKSTTLVSTFLLMLGFYLWTYRPLLKVAWSCHQQQQFEILLPGGMILSLIHVWRWRRLRTCRSRWSAYH